MSSTLMQQPRLIPVQSIQAKPRWQLDPSLVFYLPLWNISGDTFLSQDACGHTVVRSGAMATGQGGMSFDGVDDYLDCGNHSSLNITSDLSIVIWLQLLNYDLGGIVDKAYNTGGYMLWAHDNFTLQLYINGSLYANAVSPALNTWTQVVALASSTGCRIYQNAQPGTLGSAATPSGNSNTLTIGRDILQRYPYIFIGEISIFNRALSAHEIQNLYDSTKGRYGG